MAAVGARAEGSVTERWQRRQTSTLWPPGRDSRYRRAAWYSRKERASLWACTEAMGWFTALHQRVEQRRPPLRVIPLDHLRADRPEPIIAIGVDVHRIEVKQSEPLQPGCDLGQSRTSESPLLPLLAGVLVRVDGARYCPRVRRSGRCELAATSASTEHLTVSIVRPTISTWGAAHCY
jgi:hypothetical protein